MWVVLLAVDSPLLTDNDVMIKGGSLCCMLQHAGIRQPNAA